jgi:hypothetical protein
VDPWHLLKDVTLKDRAMSRGDKSSYTDKQKRKAEPIEESYEERGTSHEEAQRRAWATVNKESGGGNKSGSGRGKKDTHESSSSPSISTGRVKISMWLKGKSWNVRRMSCVRCLIPTVARVADPEWWVLSGGS